jgi:hypothetical protein
LDLDHGGNAVFLNAGHDAGEPVPRRLRDGGPLPLASIVLEPSDFGQRNETLAAC